MAKPWSDAVQQVLDKVRWGGARFSPVNSECIRIGDRCPLEDAAGVWDWDRAASRLGLSLKDKHAVMNAADGNGRYNVALRAEMLRLMAASRAPLPSPPEGV